MQIAFFHCNNSKHCRGGHFICSLSHPLGFLSLLNHFRTFELSMDSKEKKISIFYLKSYLTCSPFGQKHQMIWSTHISNYNSTACAHKTEVLISVYKAAYFSPAGTFRLYCWCLHGKQSWFIHMCTACGGFVYTSMVKYYVLLCLSVNSCVGLSLCSRVWLGACLFSPHLKMGGLKSSLFWHLGINSNHHNEER